jgi:hypothetical protein
MEYDSTDGGSFGDDKPSISCSSGSNKHGELCLASVGDDHDAKHSTATYKVDKRSAGPAAAERSEPDFMMTFCHSMDPGDGYGGDTSGRMLFSDRKCICLDCCGIAECASGASHSLPADADYFPSSAGSSTARTDSVPCTGIREPPSSTNMTLT